MPRKADLDEEALTQLMEELPALMRERDAAEARWRAVEGELRKHREAWEALDDQIESILAQLPQKTAAHAAKRARKPKPWE